MWCDDFDMDLPKVIPGALEALGDLANVELITDGGQTDGKLNHPSVWNGDGTMLAFFCFSNPGRPPFYATGRDREVRCTFWEAVRDAWPHGYLIQVEQRPVWDTHKLWPDFEKIMGHIRGWRTFAPADFAAIQGRVLVDLRGGVARFSKLVEQYALAVRRREVA